jgi:signal transduction histidine kinase
MRSITLKLTLTFLAVSLAGVALVAIIIWSTTSMAFNQFLLERGQSDFAAAASAYYQENGSWDGVTEALTQQGLISAFQSGNNPGNTTSNTPGGPPGSSNAAPPLPFALADQNGIVVVRGGPFNIGDVVPASKLSGGTAVTVNGQQVGTVIPTGNPPQPDPSGDRYLAQTNQALLIAALGAAGLALLLGIFLARSVTRPVRDLTAAAHAMAEGQLGQQLPVRSRDELGQLTTAFNRMSADLQRANELRRQMTADIAHDLRTPLAVITGYLEGLRDGVLKPTPQRYEVLFNEAHHLQRLVEDLRTLSLADAGELAIYRTPEAPADLLERLAQAFQQQAEQQKVSLKLAVEPGLPNVNVDPERIEQVLANLVSNALRFTPQGGEIWLIGRQEAGAVALEVQDNGAGIDPEALPHVFERFYRGDDARQGDSSGLGLAIAKSVIELHGGSLTVKSAGAGQGSIFTIRFPVASAAVAETGA